MFPDSESAGLERIASYPRAVVDIPTVWIPLCDGTRLAARVWLPEGAEENPVPAVLEHIPYRRRDGRRVDDEQIHPFFAGNGIAAVRVDLRGSGDSEGLLEDEYLEREQDDALEVIAWMAAQRWCNGAVGMMGLSWGGFAALQAAARRPPALRAIIAAGATVDRYNDDVHYKNGCLLNENFGWASTSLAFASRPPDPAVVGERWREMWIERLRNLRFLAEPWLGHQLRDAYWKHGSVCERYQAIEVPVMIVTGWADLYVNAVPRLLENLETPCRAIAGPWAHQYPHLASPGPTMDFLGEALAWWRRWLTETPTGGGALREYVAFCQEGSPPDPFAREVPGRWLTLDRWPGEGFASQALHLTADGLREAERPAPGLSFRSPVDAGTEFGELIPHCAGAELPGDQRHDDGASLVFDGLPLEEPLAIWGDPALELELSSDCASGHLIVRLCDVAPDGASERVSYGMLNLEHRYGNDRLVAMSVNVPQRLLVRLNHVAHCFPSGHRVRLALSTACWPAVWPAAEDPVLTLSPAPARLTLPVMDRARQGAWQPAPARAPEPPRLALRRKPGNRRRVVRRQDDGRTLVDIEDDYGEVEFGDERLVMDGIKRERYSILRGDPLSAEARFHWTLELSRGEWRIRTETRTHLTADRQGFHLTARVTAFEGEHEVIARDWSRQVARQRSSGD